MIDILKVQGFVLKETEGSHAQYEKGPQKVTVDMAVREFDPFLLGSMIRQAGLDRDTFYTSTKIGAKKINKRFGR